MTNKAGKTARYSPPDEHGGRTCTHRKYGDSSKCAEMYCWNYYMKGTDGFWSNDLPGMWEAADFTGGETDNDLAARLDDELAAPCPCDSGLSALLCKCRPMGNMGPETFQGVKVPDTLRPNWFDNRVEVSWWKSGVRSALESESDSD